MGAIEDRTDSLLYSLIKLCLKDILKHVFKLAIYSRPGLLSDHHANVFVFNSLHLNC